MKETADIIMTSEELTALLEVRDGCCGYCGIRMNNTPFHEHCKTVDHIIPKSNGGTQHPLNRFKCCVKCNRMKADHNLNYFLDKINTCLQYNIGGSKTTKKRWAHMHQQVSRLIRIIEPFKRDILRYKHGKR